MNYTEQRAPWRVWAVCWLAALVWGLPATVAEADRVLIVLSSNATPYQEAYESCAKKLAGLGYDCNMTQLPSVQRSDLNSMLYRDTAAVITLGTPATVYVHERLDPEVPLLYAMVSQPQLAGLTEGRPCTGISTDVPLPDQLSLIHRAIPVSHRIGVLHDRGDGQNEARIKELREGLPKDCELVTISVDDYDSLAEAINALLKLQPTIIWTEPDASIYNAASIRALLLTALRHKTPVFGFSSAFVKAGALIGINIETTTQGEQVAELTRQMLTGPQTEPPPRIMTPHYEVAVNLIVAEKLNIRIDEHVLESASIVYRE